MEFNPYRRYAMMITVEMITDDYTAVYHYSFQEAVNRSQVFIERKIMNLEKSTVLLKSLSSSYPACFLLCCMP